MISFPVHPDMRREILADMGERHGKAFTALRLDVVQAPGGQASLRCRGLPAPFGGPMTIGFRHGVASAEEAARSLARLLEDRTELAERYHAFSAAAHRAAEGTEALVLSTAPCGYWASYGPDGELTVTANVELVNEALAVERRSFLLGDSVHGGGLGALRVELRRQAERRARMRHGLSVDTVMWHHLRRMTDRQRAALAKILREHPKPPTGEPGCSSVNDWPNARLAARGIPLPAAVETIRAKHGRITGRVRLGRRTAWNDGVVKHHGETAPESIVSSLRGRRIGDVLTHEALEADWTVDDAFVDGRGWLRVKVTAPSVSFPTGTQLPGRS